MRTLLADQFQRSDVLNIFCDGSTVNYHSTCVEDQKVGCYGAIAVINDEMFDELYRITTNITNNKTEIKGLRAAVDMAIMYRNYFRVLNIFCDSEVSVLGVRDRCLDWPIENHTMYTKAGSPVKSQEIFFQIINSIIRYDVKINFWWLHGHMKNSGRKIVKAGSEFKYANDITERKVDLNLIRYISKWNNIVDERVRTLARQFKRDREYIDPIEFIPQPFDKYKYSQLTDLNNGIF